MDMISVVTKDEIISSLFELGLSKGDHLIVHVSLKSMGYVIGGAETVIRAIQEVIGEEGTILAPTQTWKNLDPSRGVHDVSEEYWELMRKEWPAYDPAITPSLNMGAVPEMIRNWPESHRSSHPARSFAAMGGQAELLTANHDLEECLGDKSPLGRLYDLDGYILLLGVDHSKSTSLHLSEHRVDYNGKAMMEESSAITVDGKREWVTYTTLDVNADDFQTLGAEYESEFSTTISKIGTAEVRLFNMRHLVDWAAEWMKTHR